MSDFSIERRLNELRKIAGDYAKAQADRIYLDEFKKSKLAILQKKYAKDFDTNAAQEREARADKEYLELLDGLKIATENAEKLYWELQIARMGAELWRTKQANMRVERHAYGT